MTFVRIAVVGLVCGVLAAGCSTRGQAERGFANSKDVTVSGIRYSVGHDQRLVRVVLHGAEPITYEARSHAKEAAEIATACQVTDFVNTVPMITMFNPSLITWEGRLDCSAAPQAAAASEPEAES